MKKIIFLLALGICVSLAEESGLDFNKKFVGCSYYVEQKGDLSRQQDCLDFAKSLEGGESLGRAAWYYILGGDTKSAKRVAKKAIKQKENFAAEHVAMAYMLEGDVENASKYYKLFFKNVSNPRFFIDKHLETMQIVYPKRFDIQKTRDIISSLIDL